MAHSIPEADWSMAPAKLRKVLLHHGCQVSEKRLKALKAAHFAAAPAAPAAAPTPPATAPTAAAPAPAPATAADDDFGDFGDFEAPSADAGGDDDGFGDFSSAGGN